MSPEAKLSGVRHSLKEILGEDAAEAEVRRFASLSMDERFAELEAEVIKERVALGGVSSVAQLEVAKRKKASEEAEKTPATISAPESIDDILAETQAQADRAATIIMADEMVLSMS